MTNRPQLDVALVELPILALHSRVDAFTAQPSWAYAMADVGEYQRRFEALFAQFGPIPVPGLSTYEPLVIWVDPDLVADLERAMSLANRLARDPALGLGGQLPEAFSARSGIAFGHGRTVPPDSPGPLTIGTSFMGEGVSRIGRRAAQLAHAAPPGSMLIDDWVREELDRLGRHPGMRPVWIDGTRAAWSVEIP